MAKLPKEIRKILLTLQDRNQYAYVFGKSLKDLVLGKEIDIWNILTGANTSQILKLFPEGETVSGEPFQIEFEVESEGKSSKIHLVHITCFEGTMDEYLQTQFIKADTIAFDGKDFLNPYCGLEDIENETIEILCDSEELFRSDPVKMFDIVQAAADTNFDIAPRLRTSIKNNAVLLKNVDKSLLTECFGRLLVSAHTGKGLRMLDTCCILPVIMGESLYKTRGKREIKAFNLYCENIDKTKRIADRRIVSFYLGFWNNRDIKAMKNMQFNAEFREKLLFAHKHLSDLHYIKKVVELKDFLYMYGLEAYNFLNDIAKVQAKIYGLDTKNIINMHATIKEIAAKNEPVFLEDLSMNAEALIKEGLAKDQYEADRMLNMLVYIVHRHPDYNEPVLLLSQAYRLNKSIFTRIRYSFVGGKY